MGLDVQIFTEPAAKWRKPDGAIQVDVIMRGGQGGGKEGEFGELKAVSFAAGTLEDEIGITVAAGGRGDDGEPSGFAGYAVVITHLTQLSEQIGLGVDEEPVGITLAARHWGSYRCAVCDAAAEGEWDGDAGHSNMAVIALNAGGEHARTSGHKVVMDSRVNAR